LYGRRTEERIRTMKRCLKCGSNVIAEQQNVKSGWYLIRCANLNCCHASIEMPFMWLARIAWNKEKGAER
jgi:ssDNA-binding Zn-finger/Zn-ribbon topoisomerase 1